MDRGLLERDDALAAMGAALEAARAGSGRLVLVTGEAGVGKTSVAERFIEAHPDCRFLRGYCEALATPRSLGPLFDFESRLPARLREALRAEADRRADFYRGLLDEFSQPGPPTVMVLEDLHWADGATLELVRFIGRRIRGHRALVVVTARDDPQSWAVIAPAVGEIATSSLVRIALAPLSRHAVAALASGRGWNAAALHEATGGNPFFVTEVLRGGAGGRQLPQSVRDAVETRMRKLPDAARAFAQAVSIFPRQAAVSELSALGVDIALADECIGTGLLQLDDGAFRFRHELARAAVELAMPPARRMALHRALLQVLAGHPAGSVPLARLAHHAQQAADVKEVLRWAPAAAREAAARGSRREAAQHCQAALDHSAQLPVHEHAQLLEDLADSQFELNRLEDSATSYRRASDLFAAVGATGAQARCLAKQAMPLVRLLRNEDADATSRRALALARCSGEAAVLGFASSVESYLRMLNRDCREAIEIGGAAIRIAQELQLPALLASGYKTTGAALVFLDYAQGCALLERSLAVAQELEDGGTAAADAYLMLGTASGELHEFDAAERFLEEGISFARSRDLDRQALYMEAWQALCEMYACRWDAAAERALAVLEQERQPSTCRVVALVTLGRLRARRGDPAAGEMLDEALALAQRSGTLQRLGPACAARAEAAWLRGDPEAALREVERVWDLAVAKGQRWILGELAYWRFRCGEAAAASDGYAPPYEAELKGDWAGAAELWRARGCPYESARALACGDEAAQERALRQLDALAARPLATRVRAALRARGRVVVPRGPVASTRANPAGLTRRELEVLHLLMRNLKNQEIAAALSRSVRTVDHHVESLYAKLEVSSRAQAVKRARELGLVDEK